MYLKICIIHDMFDNGDGWKESSEDVTEIARRLRKPCTVAPCCPKCIEKQKVKENFLKLN